jgi:NAD(P)-dependent dehydrogenase (short-subunit alcohol dehydrogenase family)
MKTLSDKVALVTGGGAGIGQAIALALAAEGAAVAIADLNETSAQSVAGRIMASGGRSLGIQADCGDVASIQTMVAQVVQEFGTLDVIVNNAGLTRTATILDVTEEDWDLINRINAKGVFFCLQAAARQMVLQGCGGRIINIASISGRGHKRSSSVAYAASKGAVIAMTKIAAQQLAEFDINVNAICPGPTSTELVAGITAARARESGKTVEDILNESRKSIPLGRYSTPEDIAAMVVFLASIGGRNITGQSYNVDGGLVMS